MDQKAQSVLRMSFRLSLLEGLGFGLGELCWVDFGSHVPRFVLIGGSWLAFAGVLAILLGPAMVAFRAPRNPMLFGLIPTVLTLPWITAFYCFILRRHTKSSTFTHGEVRFLIQIWIVGAGVWLLSSGTATIFRFIDERRKLKAIESEDVIALRGAWPQAPTETVPAQHPEVPE